MIKEIRKMEDLLEIEETGEYVLKNDLDLEGKNINCLCKYFKGMIDGDGHYIRNFVLSDIIWGDEQTLALFYNMSHAIIKNMVTRTMGHKGNVNWYTNNDILFVESLVCARNYNKHL